LYVFWSYDLANLKQSKKRVRQDKKKRFLNKSNLSMVRTYIKKFLKLISIKDFKLASKDYPLLVSKIDKSVCKGIFHKNKADRLKSRLNLKLKSLKGM